jgi:hypothetical protein
MGLDLVRCIDSHKPDKNNQCLRDLKVTDPRDDKKRIEDAKGGLLRDAYYWVFGTPEFEQWQRGDNQLLWIRGDPGKGKTMLLCGIIDHLHEQLAKQPSAKTPTVAFFFCQATDDHINNARAVLRGLIYMLVTQQPTLLSHVRNRYDGFGKKKLFEDANSWVALSEIFNNILKGLDSSASQTTYLIIDALDECVKDQDQLLHLVTQESSSYRSIRWIVSSRNWPNIEANLEPATEKVTLRLELNEHSVSAAVRSYILFKVSTLAERNKYIRDIQEDVKQYLLEHADGTFLWVALVCQELAKFASNTLGWKVLEKLRSFPPGLNALYERMLKQIRDSDPEDAERCKDILAIVSAVYRPLTLDELVAVSDKLHNIPRDDKALEDLVSLCGSFLTLRQRTIYFIHQSAKDFLFGQARDEIFPSGLKDRHYHLMSRSLQVMQATLHRDIYKLKAPGFPIKRVQPPSPDPLAAVRYSCEYWIDHLVEAEDKANMDLKDNGAVHTFLRKKLLYWFEAVSLLRCLSKGIKSHHC